MADSAACSEATSATRAGISSRGTSETRCGVSRSARSGGRSTQSPTPGPDDLTVTLSQSDFERASVAVSHLSTDGNDVLRCCAMKALVHLVTSAKCVLANGRSAVVG